MKSRVGIKKLPSYVLAGARPIRLSYLNRFRIKLDPGCVSENLGVRRVNEICLEVFPGARTFKMGYSSAIGVLFLLGLVVDIIMFFLLPGPHSIDEWLIFLSLPFFAAAVGGLLYLIYRGSPGSSVRICRATRNIYYVVPDEFRLVTLDWQEIQPVVARFVIGGGGGKAVFNPLLLVGVDWTQSPPRETSISCGNLGWNDDGKSACELFSYIQHFMDYGPQELPMPDALPPKMSRRETFLYGYRQWAAKFRKDLSTPKGKRWAVLWAPAKVLWLITMVFPDSIGAYLDYTVPEVRFPQKIDVLCGFDPDGDDAQ